MFGTTKYPDGARLLDPAEDRLWLVFDGACHHVVCNDVYSRLFRPQVAIQKLDSKIVHEGDKLIFGTRLVRGQGTTAAYLVAVHPNKVRLHPVSDFDKYGFDLSLCQPFPLDVIKEMPKGRALA